MSTNFRVAKGSSKTKISCNTKDDNEGTNINYDVCKKSNGGELEQTRAWATLNENVIGIIGSYLHPVDYLHFRAACRNNRSANPVANWKMSITETPNGTLAPWLVFSKKNDAIYSFIDPMHDNDRFLMNLSEFLVDSTVLYSKGSWLLMSRGEISTFFFNPFTREIIKLPDFNDDIHSYFIHGISFSSLPTASDCEVFALNRDEYSEFYLFSISRRHNNWNLRRLGNRVPRNGKVMNFSALCNNPVFYDGEFYCLDRHGTVGVFFGFHLEVLGKLQNPCNSINQCYLVECEQQLLSVFVGHNGEWVGVFRLDLKKEVWVEIKSLQKNMILISNTSCVSIIAPSTHMENKIYFPRFSDEKIMFYSLDTGKYNFVGDQHSAQDFCNTEVELYCSLVQPNWSKTAVEELNWLNAEGLKR